MEGWDPEKERPRPLPASNPGAGLPVYTSTRPYGRARPQSVGSGQRASLRPPGRRALGMLATVTAAPPLAAPPPHFRGPRRLIPQLGAQSGVPVALLVPLAPARQGSGQDEGETTRPRPAQGRPRGGTSAAAS